MDKCNWAKLRQACKSSYDHAAVGRGALSSVEYSQGMNVSLRMQRFPRFSTNF